MANNLLFSSITFVLIGLVICGIFVFSRYLGPQKKQGTNKNQVYESGVSSPIGNTKVRFAIKFYLVAILFVLFDIEIIFMFPWAVNVKELGFFGLTEMFVFMGLLFLGLIYIYKKKALSWD